MKLGEILEFRKDLYFEGAVQADWFYDQGKADKVACSFMFHGSKYKSKEKSGLASKQIDTIGFTEKLGDRLKATDVNPQMLAIADYGTGKSHLAVTLAQLYSGPDYMPDTYNRVIENIGKIDQGAAQRIRALYDEKNFVIVLNGMRDFNLNAEILKSVQSSFQLYGLPMEDLTSINRSVENAASFFRINKNTLLAYFENEAQQYDWPERGDDLIRRIDGSLLTDATAYQIVDNVYQQVTGRRIQWDEGITASSVLDLLVDKYCEPNGPFQHVIILFDELGRYLEYSANVNDDAKSGESALQKIFEAEQNADGRIQMVAFIQRDISAYLNTVDNAQNQKRYVGRFHSSELAYLSSNLETVFANLIYRTDREAFQSNIISWQNSKESEWRRIYADMTQWLPMDGLWQDYDSFRRVVVEGIYPMHPLATYVLTHLSDYFQNRSSLTMIREYIDRLSGEDIDRTPPLIYAEYLMRGDLFEEMYSAEQNGFQTSDYCLKYTAIITKKGDKLSADDCAILRANLILRILKFKTTSLDNTLEAIQMCTNFTLPHIKEIINILENEYGCISYDERANCYDFLVESIGAHDFKILIKRLTANAVLDTKLFSDEQIKNLGKLDTVVESNYGNMNRIRTAEWSCTQELMRIEDLTADKANDAIRQWKAARSASDPKGQLIWVYTNNETDPDEYNKAYKISAMFENMPIVIMLLEDYENKLYSDMLRFQVLSELPDDQVQRFQKHYDEECAKIKENIRIDFDDLKRKRTYATPKGKEAFAKRLMVSITDAFQRIYPQVIPFDFDSFLTKQSRLVGKSFSDYGTILRMLYNCSVNEDSYHNCSMEIRNRMEAVLMTGSYYSWQCIDKKTYQICPPQHEKVLNVYNEILSLLQHGSLSFQKIFEIYTQPQFGISEEVLILLVGVIVANNGYRIAFQVQDEPNRQLKPSEWTEWLFGNDGRKKAIKIADVVAAAKATTLIFVDEAIVGSEYSVIINQIMNTRSAREVIQLGTQLSQLRKRHEVPKNIEKKYGLASFSADKANSIEFHVENKLKESEDQFESAARTNDYINVINIATDINNLDIEQLYINKGFDPDKEHMDRKATLTRRMLTYFNKYTRLFAENKLICHSYNEIGSFKRYCDSIAEKLDDAGYSTFADQIRNREGEQVELQEALYEQQGVIQRANDVLNTKVELYTHYDIQLKIQKELNQSIKEVADIKEKIGHEGTDLLKNLLNKQSVVKSIRQKIDQEITKLWDAIDNIQTLDDVNQVITDINTVSAYGMNENDSNSLQEAKEQLTAIQSDLSIYRAECTTRKEAILKQDKLLNKYRNLEDIQFEPDDVIKNTCEDIMRNFDQAEKKWVDKNVTLGNGTVEDALKFESNVEYPPEYLSDQVVAQIDKMKKQANQIISEGRIEEVKIRFEQLSSEDQKKCLGILIGLMR